MTSLTSASLRFGGYPCFACLGCSASAKGLLHTVHFILLDSQHPVLPLVWMCMLQLCLTLCHPMDCSPPGSPVHGMLQARIQERVASFLLQGIFLTQGSHPSLSHCRQILYRLSHQGTPYYLSLPIKAMHIVLLSSKPPSLEGLSFYIVSGIVLSFSDGFLQGCYQNCIYYALKNLSCVRFYSISINPHNNPLKEVL